MKVEVEVSGVYDLAVKIEIKSAWMCGFGGGKGSFLHFKYQKV